jgi:hypothetical protein
VPPATAAYEAVAVVATVVAGGFAAEEEDDFLAGDFAVLGELAVVGVTVLAAAAPEAEEDAGVHEEEEDDEDDDDDDDADIVCGCGAAATAAEAEAGLSVACLSPACTKTGAKSNPTVKNVNFFCIITHAPLDKRELKRCNSSTAIWCGVSRSSVPLFS